MNKLGGVAVRAVERMEEPKKDIKEEFEGNIAADIGDKDAVEIIAEFVKSTERMLP